MSCRAHVSALVAASLCAGPARAGDWDGPDKPRHLVAGLGFAAAGDMLAATFARDPDARAVVGFGLGTLAGLGKEGLDAVAGGDPSLGDLGWTALGAALGASLTWLLSRAFDR